MLKTLAKIFGFTTALKPPSPVRGPSARNRPSAVPATPPKPRRDVAVRPKAPLRIPTLGEAVHAYAKSVGEFGSKPSPEYMALCRQVIGEDYWAFLQAFTLDGGRVTTFSIGVPRLGDPAAEAGLEMRLEKLAYTDLDFWDRVTKLIVRRQDAARFAGRPEPESIAIPDRVLQALAKRLANRARTLRGARGTSSGGVKATPESTESQVSGGGPEGDPENPDGAPAVALPVPK